MSRGVLALYKKTLNKSLGLIYLFLEHCKNVLQCSRFFLEQNFYSIDTFPIPFLINIFELIYEKYVSKNYTSLN